MAVYIIVNIASFRKQNARNYMNHLFFNYYQIRIYPFEILNIKSIAEMNGFAYFDLEPIKYIKLLNKLKILKILQVRYLHPNENPSLILVSPSMNGQNYHSWFRSMRIFLLSKNKLKFMDGSISVPSKEDVIFHVWERCNNMVLSWILRSLSPSIAQSILWMDNALDCHYDVLKIVKDYQEGDYVIRFLKGLNECFSVVKTQTLMMDPLPKINKAFSLVLQHERQMGVGVIATKNNESVIFTTQGNTSFQKNFQGNGSFQGDRIYRPLVNSYNFRPQGRQGGQKRFYAAPIMENACYYDQEQVSEVNKARMDEGDKHDNNNGGIALHNSSTAITQEQYKQLMSLLHQNNMGSSITPRVNTISTKAGSKVGVISTQETGTHLFAKSYFKSFVACSFNKKPANIIWIIDSGATDYVVCSLDAFTSYKLVYNVFVTLPNFQKLAVTHIGVVRFSDDLILRDVLFVPDFSFNLISTSKLTAQYDYCFILHKNICVIHDPINWRMIRLAKQVQVLDSSVTANNIWHFCLGHLANSRLKYIWGPSKVHSLYGHRYFLTIVDDKSR
ncbi:uncharacterized protein LOC126660517 [Mercurialis annua]|uniref:uncharacterized protein LOC126660517 n=1 Tax=Mercurialis annua TaxID=3986 RepID=UPI002160185C|nr:uncharacterized protein LOC126660517 [Mercurialis annua]